MTSIHKRSFDENEAGSFSDRIGEVIDNGATTMMLSLGHRLGLFDTMAKLSWCSSAQVADAAELAERYVREWLATMTVAGVVRYDAATRRYRLPAEHAACLTRRAPLGNFAVYAQMVALAGKIYDKLLVCFETGEGLSYSHYPDFHRVMAEDSAQTVAANIAQILEQLGPDLVERLRHGIDVLDAGCGAGGTLLALAAQFPASRFVGYDLCDDAIAQGARDAALVGASNVALVQKDLGALELEHRFDLVTSFDAVHDTKDPRDVLHRIYHALKPGGVHVMQDIGGSVHLENNIDFPFAAFLYTCSTVHCTPVSLAQGGCGLGAMWGWETAQQMLRQAGFSDITRHVLDHDAMNVWFVSRKTQHA